MNACITEMNTPSIRIGSGYRIGNTVSETSTMMIVSFQKVFPNNLIASERGFAISSIRFSGRNRIFGSIYFLKYLISRFLFIFIL